MPRLYERIRTRRPAAEVTATIARRLASLYLRVRQSSSQQVIAEGVRNGSYVAKISVSIAQSDDGWIVTADHVDRMKHWWLALAIALTTWQLLAGRHFWFYVMLTSTTLIPTLYAYWRHEKLVVALGHVRAELEAGNAPVGSIPALGSPPPGSTG